MGIPGQTVVLYRHRQKHDKKRMLFSCFVFNMRGYFPDSVGLQVTDNVYSVSIRAYRLYGGHLGLSFHKM